MATPDSVSRYDVNDLVRFVATFVSTDGITLADASTVTFYLRNPIGSVASYVYTGGAGGGSIQRLAAGQYAKDTTLDVVGSWFYRWAATGGIQANEEWSCLCDTSFVL
jgi:hypothetical protein